MWTATSLRDRAKIEAYIQRDRLYGAYALGDLEQPHFEQTEWATAHRDGEIGALALHYRGLRVPALLLMGHADGVEAILADVLCPERVYLTCREAHLRVTKRYYSWSALAPMWRMAAKADKRIQNETDSVRLMPKDSQRLEILYSRGPGNAFDPRQLDHGVFYGRFVSGELVSVAGTHLVSPSYRLAAIGNVFTHPDHRGHGHATGAIKAVMGDLAGLGIETIILNVHQDNAAALSIYEKLGFQRHCPFWEGLATSRRSQDDARTDIEESRRR